MSGPKKLLKLVSSLSCFWPLNRTKLGNLKKGVHGGKKGGSLWWKHPRAKSLGEKDLEEEEEEDWKRRMASIQI